jgi:hypothetical protein
MLLLHILSDLYSLSWQQTTPLPPHQISYYTSDNAPLLHLPTPPNVHLTSPFLSSHIDYRYGQSNPQNAWTILISRSSFWSWDRPNPTVKSVPNVAYEKGDRCSRSISILDSKSARSILKKIGKEQARTKRKRNDKQK